MVENISSGGPDGALVKFDGGGSVGTAPRGEHQLRVAAEVAHLTKLTGRLGGLPKQRNVMYSSTFRNAQDRIVRHEVEARRVLTLYGLIFRPNYNLRRRSHILISRLIKERLLPPHAYGHSASIPGAASSARQCAAIHIRRGDRMVQEKMPVGMREYCYIARGNGSISRDACTTEALEKVDFLGLPRDSDCGSLLDKGCFDVHPFGSLTLQDYLSSARELLPGVQDAFVMTDDSAWLEDQIRALPMSRSPVAGMRIGRVPVEAGERISKNGTKYTVDFWASVALARHCQVFVGHFGSAVSSFVYNAMCFQHGERTGECPDACDIGSTIN